MSMRRPRFNMGRVDWIGAEAVGVPGQRTFRLLAYTRETSAQLWLEKEQLQALAEAIARMLMEIDAERGAPSKGEVEGGSNPRPPDFPANPEIEFHVGQLGLRYDSQRDLIALEAFDREEEEESQGPSQAPAFRCLTTRGQIEILQTASLEAIAGGRPRCPLCNTPLSAQGMPHFCPPTNGHQKLATDED